MITVYCVRKNLDQGADALIWVCSTWEIAQGKIDAYGLAGSNYYIQEEELCEDV